MITTTEMTEKRPVYKVHKVDYDLLKTNSSYRDGVFEFIKEDNSFSIHESGSLFLKHAFGDTYEEISPVFLRRSSSGRITGMDSLDTMERVNSSSENMVSAINRQTLIYRRGGR